MMAATTESNGLGEPLADASDAKVDIVFVHGLMGDRVRTWTSEPGEYSDTATFWPRDLLPAKCKAARILSFGYNAAITDFYPFHGAKAVMQTTVNNHSNALLDDLLSLRSRTGTDRRPIFFVAHSLGGLVCANAVSRPYESEPIQHLVASVRGMIFLGTPFAGSKMTKWGDIAEKLISLFAVTNREYLKDLAKQSELLVQIDRNFAQFIKARDKGPKSGHIELACYFEGIPTPISSGMIAKKMAKKIVDEASASLAGVDLLAIEARHTNMCKFENEFRSGFISISGKLSDWIKNLDAVVESDEKRTGLGDITYNAPVKNNGGLITGHVTEKAKLIGSQTTNNHYGRSRRRGKKGTKDSDESNESDSA
ncbi:putative ribonuclease p/mrp subunit [Podospora aff. communis PSN243]|uniref:Ribonuclease p/mrp subunit n=1 Tax=Podospora aff. communis PSN243 TaxID=3040156 RepID=A0AAV9GQ00_9PEZI|nr:putative ribonuclease p/mrp subunit [Podospora aff. communis PSN243]